MKENIELRKGDIVTIKYKNYVDDMLIKSPKINSNELIGELIKVKRTVKYETIYEKKEILDDVEKDYLRNVIKPFKNKVKYIAKKNEEIDDREYILFIMKKEVSFALPYFKRNTMYKNMELNKEYSVEELGL